jgi:hypothetical protein
MNALHGLRRRWLSMVVFWYFVHVPMLQIWQNSAPLVPAALGARGDKLRCFTQGLQDLITRFIRSSPRADI